MEAKKAFEWAIGTGEIVSVTLTTAAPLLQIPDQFKKEPYLKLDFGHKKAPPVQVTATGVSAQLSFGGRWVLCFVPWEAMREIFVESLGALCYQDYTRSVEIREVASAPAVVVDPGHEKAQAKPRDPNDLSEPLRFKPTRNGKATLTLYQGGAVYTGSSKAQLKLVKEDDHGNGNGK